jgi:sugar phosphate isomerase/epimerase
MHKSTPRRQFLKSAIATTGSLSLASLATPLFAADKKPWFKLSLGEWSLHRALFGGNLKHFDVAKTIRQDFGIDGLEYSAQFFKDKAADRQYLDELKKRAEDYDVQPVLITVDGEGDLGDPDGKRRTAAVENHYKWVEAGRRLGCESIRVNAYSDKSLDPTEQAKLVVDGLTRLVDFGAKHKINVIVENHGFLSSNGQWLAGVIKQVNRPTCGTLPDFGNFHLSETEEYDRYEGVAQLMPYAKGISAKSYEFDADGNETRIDYRRMMKLVRDADYHGYVGIEYEGAKLSEPEGILATKRLLLSIHDELLTA